MSNFKNEDLEKSIIDFFEKSKNSNDPALLEDLQKFLEKARKRMSDEYDPNDEEDDEFSEEHGFRQFDPDEEQQDDADKWLQENDPEQGSESNEEPNEEDEYYDEYSPDEDEESHQQLQSEDEEPEMSSDVQAGDPQSEASQSYSVKESPQSQEEKVKEGRFPQPTKEELAEMRQYTRPWEQRARDTTRLRAEAHKNPVLHHEGKLVEARNAAHKNRQDAYTAFQATPEYQNADPISQMEMDAKFHQDWHEKNPDYLQNAVKLHQEAHHKGLMGHGEHASRKIEDIEHVLQGGAQPEEAMSVEEGMQHAGGAKGEEGTVGSMTQDPASAFAAANKDFLREKGSEYQGKASKQKDRATKVADDYGKIIGKQKQPADMEQMSNYDNEAAADLNRILGEHPALKNPSNKAKVDSFFQKYHPLIAMNAHKVLNQLGLDHKRGDIDLSGLHEAGMHGLFQAINDYEHENPSKASFSTHASNKIRGLMQTALRDQDKGPTALKTEAKKYNVNKMIAKHPPEIGDRLKRIQTSRQVNPPKPKSTPEGGTQ